MDLKKYIRDICDFPKPGIIFKDITPLLMNYSAFEHMLDILVEKYKNSNISKVCGIESRGFIIGAPLALRLKAGFVPIRKKGKLPYKTIEREYSLEYGTDTIEIHQDAIQKKERILLIDDLIATGGTALAATALLEEAGADLVQAAFIIELGFLKASEKIPPDKFYSMIKY